MTQIRYRKDTDLPWHRIKNGKSFSFVNEKGKRVGKTSRKRILGLGIPPAWKDVVISNNPKDYIQAIGTDGKGRHQYIYHPEWVKRNQEHKFDQMIDFGERLPTLRRDVSAHMRERGLTKRRVIATVVWLLENTFIRIGNKEYAEENKSYGLTTMREKHVKVRANMLKFSFEGKSGIFHELDIKNERVAKNVKACLELPGYELFHYEDDDGNVRVVDSSEVNDYLKAQTGADFTAKDFRTWGGSTLAGESFYQKGEAKDKNDLTSKIVEVVKIVSDHLGNTKNVCKEYYIHPAIITSYERKILVPHFKRSYGRHSTKRLGLTQEEYATWSLIKDS